MEDRQLSDHFSLYELTVTNNAALQGVNRELTDSQIYKLMRVAELLEKCGKIIAPVCGNDVRTPIHVHSGYRSLALNGATSGSSSTSQHPLCEAADWTPISPKLDYGLLNGCFEAIHRAALAKQIEFGQMILEHGSRGFKESMWIHISLGSPYRDPARCGEIMTMSLRGDGKPIYQMLARIGGSNDR